MSSENNSNLFPVETKENSKEVNEESEESEEYSLYSDIAALDYDYEAWGNILHKLHKIKRSLSRK